MPTVVNGFGTWYWGKHNIVVHRGVCGFCGHLTDLKSYDTRSFIVVLYLPIVPLGRKRVLNECSVCRKHYTMNYRAWKEGCEQVLPQALEALRREPHNVQAAREVLALAAHFQQEPAFEQALSSVGEAVTQDAGFQQLLGSAYEQFSRLQEAEQAYRASLALNDDPEVREVLALNLLLQSKPDQAWDLLEHIVSEKKENRRGLPLLVAESYQSWGMHEAALSVLDDAVAAFPLLAKDSDYKKLRKTSEKHRQTNKEIKSARLQAGKRPAKPHASVSNVVAKVVPLGIVALLLTVYFGAAISKGRSREVFVVNGLDQPYDVQIGTVQRSVRPQSHALIEIPEGTVDVRVTSDAVPIEDQQCEIETNFFLRPFTDPVFVINPDQTALLLWEQVQYSQRPDTDAEAPYEIYCGNLLTEVGGVDFRFRPFPNEIDLPGGNPVTRTRLSLLTDLSPAYAVEVVDQELGRETMIDFVQRMSARSLQADMYLYAMLELVGTQEYVTLTQTLRERRPVVVDAHRLYQEIMDRSDPEHDLIAEYRGLLESQPDDPSLQYLLGRVLDDAAQARQLFTRAAGAQPPCARALAAMSYAHYVNGEFDQALPLARQALELNPESVSFRVMLSDVLAATGDYAEALDLHRKAHGAETLDYVAVERELCLLVLLNRMSDAQSRARAYAQAAAKVNESIDADEMLSSLMASIRYVQEDYDALKEELTGVSYAWSRFLLAVEAGDLTAASAALAEYSNDPYDMLLLATLAQVAGQIQQAEQLFSTALEQLNQDGRTSRRLAKWLVAASAPDPSEALAIELIPKRKAVAMVALTHKFPELADACYPMARRLNFNKQFPHHTIEQLTSTQ